jgi:hypothetical protein
MSKKGKSSSKGADKAADAAGGEAGKEDSKKDERIAQLLLELEEVSLALRLHLRLQKLANQSRKYMAIFAIKSDIMEGGGRER